MFYKVQISINVLSVALAWNGNHLVLPMGKNVKNV